MSGQYDDIIRLPHPDSPKHPQMSLYDRAAQFCFPSLLHSSNSLSHFHFGNIYTMDFRVLYSTSCFPL